MPETLESPARARATSFRLVLHALTFLTFLSLWTWKLLEPYPVPEDISEGLEKAGLSFAAAKTLHATGYAFLTVLAGTLPVSWRWRRWLVVFLVLHGAGSEILQDVMDLGRTGKLRDVLIDWAGIAGGVFCLWWRWGPGGNPDGAGTGAGAHGNRTHCGLPQ